MDLARATTSGCAVKAAGAFCLRYNVSRTSSPFTYFGVGLIRRIPVLFHRNNVKFNSPPHADVDRPGGCLMLCRGAGLVAGLGSKHRASDREQAVCDRTEGEG